MHDSQSDQKRRGGENVPEQYPTSSLELKAATRRWLKVLLQISGFKQRIFQRFIMFKNVLQFNDIIIPIINVHRESDNMHITHNPQESID